MPVFASVRGRLLAPLVLAPLAASTIAGSAAAEIRYDAGSRIFRLVGGDSEYDIGVDADGYLRPVHWGAALDPDAPLALPLLPPPVTGAMDPPSSVTAQEYAGQGGGIVVDPGIKVAFPDGNRDLVLKYRSHRIAGDTLTIELADISCPFTVTLRYTIAPATGIVGRSASARNGGTAPVRIDQIAAGTAILPYQPGYRLSYLAGRQLAEFHLGQQPIGPALTVLESRRGATSNHMSPWFAIDRQGVTSEDPGPVWFGTLGWSGSWRISVGADLIGQLRIMGGYNPYDLSWQLRPGETLDTPVLYLGYSGDGMGHASRLQHRFQIARILPGDGKPRIRPVFYNSWEATEFAINEAGQIALAGKAARTGRNVSLAYRFLSAMQGGLGIGNNLNRWSEEDFALATKMIADYKATRATVQTGSLYRLVRPDGTGPTVDTLHVAPDKRQAVLFHLLQSYRGSDDQPAIKLQGLDPDRRYTVRVAGGGGVPDGIPARATGSWWMAHGATIPLRGDFKGIGLILEGE